jgi:SAM-dependent methyltransferase
MDRDRYSFIAHTTHTICNPISSAATDEAIGVLGLGAGARVLDIGAGKGEMLARIAERCGATCTAVERSARMAQACRERGAGVSRGRVEVIESDAATWLASHNASGAPPFDAALCIGSTHALGSFAATIAALRDLVRPGGSVVLGEGYWQHEPDAAYLAALGATRDDYSTHQDNIDRINAIGLSVAWHTIASAADWAEYESRYLQNVERFAAHNPADPDHDAMLARARAWSDVVERWGRSTLGFGMYIAQRA